jgi:hypothetical protein
MSCWKKFSTLFSRITQHDTLVSRPPSLSLSSGSPLPQTSSLHVCLLALGHTILQAGWLFLPKQTLHHHRISQRLQWPPVSVPLRKSAVRKRNTKLSSATTNNPVRCALLARAQKSRECVAACVRALNSTRGVRQRTHAPALQSRPLSPRTTPPCFACVVSFCFITSA